MNEHPSSRSGPSASAPRRHIPWLDLQRRPWRLSWISRGESAPTSPISSRRAGPDSPSPWIDLQSNVSSERVSQVAYSESVYSEPLPTTPSALDIERESVRMQSEGATDRGSEDEPRRIPAHFGRPPERPSTAQQSVLSINSSISYPDFIRLVLITISVVLVNFFVSLDRTIVSTAMYCLNEYY